MIFLSQFKSANMKHQNFSFCAKEKIDISCQNIDVIVGITESSQFVLSERFGPSTWYEANATCEQNGTSLLTIRNLAKHEALKSVLALEEEE